MSAAVCWSRRWANVAPPSMRQADHPDDREEGDREDDEHLPVLGAPLASLSGHGVPQGHWILALLEVVRVNGPNALRIGSTALNEARTETRTQLPGWQVPETFAPAMSMHW